MGYVLITNRENYEAQDATVAGWRSENRFKNETLKIPSYVD